MARRRLMVEWECDRCGLVRTAEVGYNEDDQERHLPPAGWSQIAIHTVLESSGGVRSLALAVACQPCTQDTIAQTGAK